MGLNASGEQDFPDTDDDITTVSDEAEELSSDDDDESDTSLNGTETELDDDSPDDSSDSDIDDVDSDSDSAADTREDEDETSALDADTEVEDEQDAPRAKKPKRKRFNSEEYSRSVQKRINREVRKREELRAENNALQERMAALESSKVVEESNQERNLMASRINNAQAIHTQLMEDGEYQQAGKVNNDITDMKIYKRDLDAQAAYQEQMDSRPQEPQNSGQVEIPDVQMAWMEGNERFNAEKGYTAYVNEEYDRLVDDGYDPEDKALYDELDKRLGRNQKAKKSRRQAAPPPNTGTAPAGSSKSSRLTKSDLSRMEDWGLDSKDPTARKEWLSNKSA